ncbi:MAG: secondary thiamine-phosphate synthase enzyme YjbQ [Thermoplasmatota archaeon]
MIPSIAIQTTKRNQMIDITNDIKRLIEKYTMKNGYVIVFVPHTTAVVTINEGADPDVADDIIETLKRLIPMNNSFKHVEGNSDAHIKSSLLGASQCILVENNRLILGSWQHVFLYESDGPRTRTVHVKLISTKET